MTRCSASFHMLFYRVYIFSEVSVQIFGLFCNWVHFVGFWEFFVCLGYSPISDTSLQIFSVVWLLILLISVLLTWNSLAAHFLWNIISVTAIFLISVNTFAKFFQLHLWGPLTCSCALLPFMCGLSLAPAWSLFTSLLYFTLRWWVPVSMIHFVKSSEWVYHWEAIGQGSYTLLLLSNRCVVTNP